MNEFESQVLNALASIQGELTTLKTDMSDVKTRLDKIENRLEALEEQGEISRAAANYNGEKLDELTQELKRAHLIA